MGTQPILQSSFAGGELSRRLRGRLDADLYKIGLDRCENFQPLPQGPIRKRGGTEWVRSLAGDYRTRLIQFRLTTEQDYVLVLAGGTAQILDGAGLAVGGTSGGGGANLVLNGEFTPDITYWDIVAGTPYGGLGCVLVNPLDNALGRIRQTIAVPSAGLHTLEFTTAHSSPYAPTTPPAPIRVRLGTAPGGGDLYDQTMDVGGLHATAIDLAAAGTVYLDFEALAQGPGGGSLPRVEGVRFYQTAAPTTGVSFPAPWTAAQVAAVQYAAEPGANRMYFAHPNVAPYVLTRNSAGTWSFVPCVFTAQPLEWGGANWPGVVAFHAGRTYWAGAGGERNRFWASKAGEPLNLTLASGPGAPATVLPGDGLDLKAATAGSARWIRGHRALLLGTDLDENAVSGSKGVPLAGDVHVSGETSVGSAAIQAQVAAGAVVHVSGDRRQVRALVRASQGDGGWENQNLTFVAEHLTKPFVKEIHHVWAPESLLFAVLDDGTIAACSYEPGEQVVAWWRITIPNAIVRSAAASRGPAGAFLWLAVERSGAMHLERLPLGDPATTYVDAAKIGIVGEGGVCSGLAHLNGKTVHILSGGQIATAGVVADGEVTIDPNYAGLGFVAGLAYTAKAVTLPKDVRDGKARNVTIGLLVNDSALPLVNGERPRLASGAAAPVGPAQTGKFSRRGLGWDDEGKVTLEADLPFRTEILALFSSTAANDV